MLCTIKLKQQIFASDRLHILKVSNTCQKEHDIILTENKFVQCKIYYDTHTKPYVYNQIWYEYKALNISDIYSNYATY